MLKTDILARCANFSGRIQGDDYPAPDQLVLDTRKSISEEGIQIESFDHLQELWKQKSL